MTRLNAFHSPTAACRERLGSRTGSKNHSSSSDSSVRSRRSASAISSAEDVEIFHRISHTTAAVVKVTKNNNKNKSSISLDGSVGSLVGAIITSFSPTSSQDGSKNEDQRSCSDSGLSVSPASSQREDAAVSPDATTTPPKANLDLRNNDNSFHVLASLLVDFFSQKTDDHDDDAGCLTLVLPEDRLTVQRLLPESARLAFIDAVRYRLELTPVVANTPLQFLTQRCQELGLDQENPRRNPILVLANYKNKQQPMNKKKTVKVYLASRDDDASEEEDDDENNRIVESSTSADEASPSSDDGMEENVQSPTSTVFSKDTPDSPLQAVPSLSRQSTSPTRNIMDREVFDAAKYAAARSVFSADDTTTDDDVSAQPSELEAILELNESEEQRLEEWPSTIEEGETEDIEEVNETERMAFQDSKVNDESPDTVSELAVTESYDGQSQLRLQRDPSASKIDVQSGRLSEFTSSYNQQYIATDAPQGNQVSSAAGNYLADMRSLVDTTTTEESTRAQPTVYPQQNLKDPLTTTEESSSSSFFLTTGTKPRYAPYDDATTGSKTYVTTGSHTTGTCATGASTNASTEIGLISEKISNATPPNPFHVDFARYEALEVLDNTEKQKLLTQLQEASAFLLRSETKELTWFWHERRTSLMNQLNSLAADFHAASQTQKNSVVPGTVTTGSNIENMLVVPADPSRSSMNTLTNPRNLLIVPADSSRTSIQNVPPENGNTLVGPATSTDNTILDQQPSNAPDFLDQKPQPDPRWYTQATKQQDEATALNVPSNEHQDVDLPLVDVVAPADLPAGYNFEAEIEGQRFLATVPPGGVQQGETFTCYMRELDSVAIDIPVGYWKDGLCDIFAYGCCHPVVWHSLFCPLIALGQIQQRISLDFLGRPRFGDDGMSIRSTVFVVIGFWATTNLGLFAACNVKWFHGMELTIADVSALGLINIALFCFIVFVAQSTRASLREKFMIREERCLDLEDLVCATACLPCTVSQMARHTANYDDYEAVCCSKTGLPNGIRLNQGAEKEDGFVV